MRSNVVLRGAREFLVIETLLLQLSIIEKLVVGTVEPRLIAK